jgi:hypothetical protein
MPDQVVTVDQERHRGTRRFYPGELGANLAGVVRDWEVVGRRPWGSALCYDARPWEAFAGLVGINTSCSWG